MYALLLSLSISMDSIGVGLSYGVRKIKLGAVALAIILAISVGVIVLSWLLGTAISSVVSSLATRVFSCALLVVIGSVYLVNALLDRAFMDAEGEVVLGNFRIKSLRLIVNIIREPSSGDMDNSGTIDCREAAYIGTALAADALSIGFAAASFGIGLLPLAVCTAVMNFCFLKLGELLGTKTSRRFSENTLKIASGVIIIALGVLKLI